MDSRQVVDGSSKFFLQLLLNYNLTSQKSCLPQDGKPFCIILYADKAKLSSFGTEKAYPIIARCANLPDWIRNGEGIGGGRVVGWQPIVTFFSKIIGNS